jgi:2-polyprenyl-6-methoxyphenol hydroxylase-like FAD-dependent oxidoreductase
MTTRDLPPIAILGAGPSGLTLARLLKVNSIPYTIFDRDANPFASDSAAADSDPTTTTITYTPPTLSNQGGSLDIHTETGQLALREAGLFEQFEAHARYDGQAFVAVDSAAQDLARAIPGPEERGRPEIDRPVLREILLRSVLEDVKQAALGEETRVGEVVWEKKVESVERSEEDGGASGWRVRFEDGSVAGPFELIVGADGTWSKTRKAVSASRFAIKQAFDMKGRCWLFNQEEDADSMLHRSLPLHHSTLASPTCRPAFPQRTTFTLEQRSKSAVGAISPSREARPFSRSVKATAATTSTPGSAYPKIGTTKTATSWRRARHANASSARSMQIGTRH